MVDVAHATQNTNKENEKFFFSLLIWQQSDDSTMKVMEDKVSILFERI
jgi:hypothetical protein